MNNFPIPPFTETFAGQMMTLQKSLLENSLAAADMLHEETTHLFTSVWDQIPWLPDEGKKMATAWVVELQEEGKRIRHSVREGFDHLEKNLTRAVSESGEEPTPGDDARSDNPGQQPQGSRQDQDAIGQSRQELAEAGAQDHDREKTPDVLLDVPTLNFDEIKMDVDKIDARIALKAELANLVRIEVGAQIGIGNVELDIKGVEAQALMKVRLEEVNAIFSRALETLDRYPDLISNLAGKTGENVEAVSDSESSLQEIVKGVTARERTVQKAIREVSKGIDQAVQAKSKIQEKEKRHEKKEKKKKG